MAKSIATGPTDTAFSGSTTLTVPIPGLNWTTDHRILSSNTGEMLTTNVTSPTNQPETFRFARKVIKDVYANTGVDPSARLSTKTGFAQLVEMRQLWKETDSVDVTYEKFIPLKVGITIQTSDYGNVTADMLLTAAKRAIAALFEKGVVTSTGMAAYQRGVLKKIDIPG